MGFSLSLALAGRGDFPKTVFLTVYDADDMGILFQTVKAHTGRVNDVAFPPDGTMIVSGGANGNLKHWDLSDP